MILPLLRTFLLRTFFGLLLIASLAAGIAYWLITQGLQRPLKIPQDYQYTVAAGSSLRQVAEDLVAQQVLDYPTAVAWLAKARWDNKANKIKAGEYAIPPASNATQLLDIFIDGKALQHALVIVEGWNVRQMLHAIQAHPKLQQNLQDVTPQQLMSALGLPDAHPEGRFFPDTYLFEKNTRDIDILHLAYQRMKQELAQAWAAKANDIPLKTPEEALILASIIEKETGAPEERPEIAGVFSRRLQQNMRLQTDPTVIYGLGAAFDGNLRRADLQRDTPYNTYTRHGLPPTPIALPGRAALHAAVNPAPGETLYFVASGGGRHYFSSNLREHDCAVIKYQIKEKAPHLLKSRCQTHPHCEVCQ